MSTLTEQLHVSAAFMAVELPQRNNDAEVCREAAYRIEELEAKLETQTELVDAAVLEASLFGNLGNGDALDALAASRVGGT